jgi:3-methylcrotonyl-CoA carboxylase alpha subunit/acetyl-CoA/propionyl-CoA carboxylase biotin carboxyl carrier protein
VDTQTGDFVFLEMNTRLQVEHPVTELVTGLDLVQLQLLVAQGLPLPMRQKDVTLTGSAIEVRVYAEDPDSSFLPQAGTADLVRWPERARVDAALASGQVVGTSYDPMLGKVIAFGTTREGARRKLIDALDDTAILGLTTNLGFLRRLAASDAFRDAAIDTAWLDRAPDALPREVPDLARIAAGWALATQASTSAPSSPFGTHDGWRLAGPAAPYVVELDHRGAPVVLTIDRFAGSPVDGHPHRVRLDVDGVLSELTVLVQPAGVTVGLHGESFHFAPRDTTSAAAVDPLSDGTVSAPMPGLVREVLVGVGSPVKAGEVLAVMEAMKMELSLAAPFDGVVAEVAAKAGGQVKLGERLFLVTANEGEAP